MELYSKLHGVELSESHPDIQLSYELLVSSWEGRKTIKNTRTEPWPEESCRWADWELRQELYNDDDELLAIGKPAAPIKNDKELLLNFIVRFDTN